MEVDQAVHQMISWISIDEIILGNSIKKCIVKNIV
jgi:hypothetical protein